MRKQVKAPILFRSSKILVGLQTVAGTHLVLHYSRITIPWTLDHEFSTSWLLESKVLSLSSVEICSLIPLFFKSISACVGGWKIVNYNAKWKIQYSKDITQKITYFLAALLLSGAISCWEYTSAYYYLRSKDLISSNVIPNQIMQLIRGTPESFLVKSV